MPAIVFTASELFEAAIRDARSQSGSILELSDLDKRPLDPGESPDARRHKIAKLGKQLALTFERIDLILSAASDAEYGPRHDTPTPPTSDSSN